MCYHAISSSQHFKSIFSPNGHTSFRICYCLNVCVSSKFVYKILILLSKMLVLGDGAFQRCLSHESRTFMNGITAFIKEALETSLASLTMWAYDKRTSAMNQKEGLHENKTLPATWSWTPELLKINFCFLWSQFSSVQFLSCVQLFVTPWTVSRQVPLSMEFSRQEYWGG